MLCSEPFQCYKGNMYNASTLTLSLQVTTSTAVPGVAVTSSNQAGVTVVTTAAPVMQIGFKFGEESANVTCPACNSLVETKVDTRVGLGAWITAGSACLLGYVLYFVHAKL